MRIIELDKNKYKVIYEIGRDYRGKRKRATKVFQAKSKRELNKLIREWTDTLSIDHSEKKQTVSMMCDAVRSQIITNKSPNTVIGYDKALSRIKSTIGAMRASQVTPKVLQSWVNALSETKSRRTGRLLSSKSIKETYSVLRLCYSVAVTWEMVPSNPCHDVVLPKSQKQEITIMSKDDFDVFVTHLSDLKPDTKIAIELALFCGLRRGEIMGIYDDDINETGVFYVERTRYKLDDEQIEKGAKTSAGHRKCVLPAFLLDDIKELREYHRTRAESLGQRWVYSPYLIKRQNGSPFIPDECNKRLKRYMLSIGLEPITFHALRHTYASMIIASGADIATVSKRMGHADINTTLGIYTHLFEDSSATDPIASFIDGIVSK